MRTSAAMLLPGVLFGIGLGVSGMTNPAKVIGFLTVTGDWDPSLAFVMVGAIGVFAVANVLVHRRGVSMLGGTLPGVRARGRVDGRLLTGAILFGVGWGLAGICPGPALANLSRLRPDVTTFVVMMALGMVISQRVFHVDAKPPGIAADPAPTTAATG